MKMEEKLTVEQISDLSIDELKGYEPENFRSIDMNDLGDLWSEEKSIVLEKIYSGLQRSQDRWVQKVLGEKKYMEQVASVALDNTKLIELWETNPDTAKKIADEYYDGISKEEAINRLTEAGVEVKSEEKLTKKQVQDIITQEKVVWAISDFKSNAGLSWDSLSKFESELKDISEGKKLSMSNINKYLRIAYSEAIPKWDYKAIESEALRISVGDGWSSTTKNNKSDKIKNENMAFLKSRWIF